MPAFQMPVTTGKRKSDHGDESSRKRPNLDGDGRSGGGHGSESYWMVQWRHHQQRKHKTWEGDAVLAVNGPKGTMYDTEGKMMCTGKVEHPLSDGTNISFGGKELELDRQIPRNEYLSGICFGRGMASAIIPSSSSTSTKTGSAAKQFTPLKVSTTSRPPTVATPSRGVPLQSVDLLSTQNSAPRDDFPKLKLEDSHWVANWRKTQSSTKKNRTWDGDAFVSQVGMKITMISEEGKIMGSTNSKGDPLCVGYRLYIGGKEVELLSEVSTSELPTIPGADQPPERSIPSGVGGENDTLAAAMDEAEKKAKFVAPTSFYGAPVKSKKAPGPLHDPKAEGAVVMKAPTQEHIKKYNKKSLPIVPVVLDPILARRMRPHQIDGVKFLYECVMGLRKYEGQGCILADEMGLGKTLQTISLIWTLLRQNPYAGSTPVVEKVLIVCPVSLTNNWKAEFNKWLGRDRFGVVICDKDKNVARTFAYTKTQQVLIVGYERLRTVINELTSCIPPIGLIICDEGHRLKTANSKTAAVFNALRTPRRIILSGTPIQNDLGEFHAMADFCNPGLLDDYNTFRRVYEAPILKSRAPSSTAKEQELGETRSAQLTSLAKTFVLRREANILGNYLPPKHEFVVFVTPTPLQLAIFAKILHPDKLDDLVQSSTAESLALINLLTKVSNSPILLKATLDKDSSAGENSRRASVRDAVTLLPERAQVEDMSLSGKLVAIAKLLNVVRQNTEEKCVLVSHYTSTLNILEAYCKKKGYSYYRLDGQTPAAKRQEYVNAFNKSSQKSSFVFLLSSKAGGVGINLIGASRLCLIDSDWNPSHDLQSMARCHRDGQKRPVFIYRFLTTGAIDEKIYQRQVTKLGLSNSLMGSGTTSSKSDSFTRKDLRDIFRIDTDTSCNTHDLLECPCGSVDASMTSDDATEEAPSVDSDEDDEDLSSGFINAAQVKPGQVNKVDKAYLQKKKDGLAALGEWTHINCLRATARGDVKDDVLRALLHSFEGDQTMKTPSPKSQLDRLLSAVDLDNIAMMDNVLSVRDVPGGTVSFLFQKSSIAPTEIADEDGADSLD